MKRLNILVLIYFISFGAIAQQKVERNVGDFSELSLNISAHVYITKGNTHKVTLEGDADDLEEIEVELKGDRLHIGTERNSWWGSNNIGKVTIYITTPRLEGVSIAGSGRVESEDVFTTSNFDANVSGSGKMYLKIEADKTDINISGSGDVELEGKSEYVEISISGSGDVEAMDFAVVDADIRIMGSGDCDLNVSGRLNSKIMGSGDVTYRGNPHHVNNNSMGSGKIRKVN